MTAFGEVLDPPFTAFGFEVLLTLAAGADGVGTPVCRGAFSECDGLALEMEPRSVTAGGSAGVVTHLVGPVRPAALTLRRGMTSGTDLWAWMAAATVPGKPRTADGQVVMLDPAGEVALRFVLTGCLPVRVRGPRLDAVTGLVAIEELGLAVGSLGVAGASGGAGASASATVSLSASASFSASFSASASASASAGVGAQVSGGLGLSGRLGGTFGAGR